MAAGVPHTQPLYALELPSWPLRSKSAQRPRRGPTAHSDCADGGSVFYHHGPTSVLTTWLHLVLSLCHPPDPHTCPSTLWSDYPSLQGREPRLALCRVTRAPDCLERASGFIHHHPAEDWLSGVRTRLVTVENPGCTVSGCLGFCPGERPCSHE